VGNQGPRYERILTIDEASNELRELAVCSYQSVNSFTEASAFGVEILGQGIAQTAMYKLHVLLQRLLYILDDSIGADLTADVP
jgi:hypothetical protein